MQIYDYQAREILGMSRSEVEALSNPFYKIKYDDGSILDVNRNTLWLDRYVWEMYDMFPKTDIVPEHTIGVLMNGKDYNGGVLENSFEGTIRHIVKSNGLTSYKTKESLARDVMRIANLIYNEVVQMSSPYVMAFDAVDCVDAVKDPVVVKIVEAIENTPDSVDRGNQAILDYSRTGVSNNSFFKANRFGASSDSQFVQLVGVRGFVTDLDRTVFTHAILRGFMLGLDSLLNMSMESKTAAKALNAAGASIRKSEYASRRFQKLVMFVESCIDTDCGSQYFTRTFMTEKYLANMEGIYYTTDDEPDVLKCIDTTEKHLVGTSINIRSAWNCTLPNPHEVCVKCAGEVFNNFRKDTNLGYLCAAYLMEKVTQRILSFKHVVKSISSSILKVEGRARKYFKGNSNNELEVRDDVDLSDLFIIISAKDLDRLSEAISSNSQHVTTDKIGSVRKIGIISRDGRIKDEMVLSSNDRQANITLEFLEHIKKSDFEVSDRRKYSIPLKGWDINTPMFEVPMKEEDVSLFVSAIEKLVEGTMDKTDTLDEHFFKLVDKILENSKCNLSTLQIMNYAISVQNPQDGNYRLGRGSSYNGFATKDLIFKNRSLAPFLIGGDQSRMILSSPEEIFSSRNRQRSKLDILYIPQQILHGRRK